MVYTSCDTCHFCIPAGLCLGYFRLVNFRAFSQRCSPLSWLIVTELLMMEGTKGEEFCWNHLLHRQFISTSCPSAFNIHTKLTFKDLNKWADTSGVGFHGRLSHWRTTARGAVFLWTLLVTLFQCIFKVYLLKYNNILSVSYKGTSYYFKAVCCITLAEDPCLFSLEKPLKIWNQINTNSWKMLFASQELQ